MAKVLKGKYFPNSSFLEATIKPNASYTWKSILSAKDLLKKGVMKLIGNGRSTNIWSEAWIPSLPNCCTLARDNVDESYPAYVADLIDNGRRNIAVLQEWFSQLEIHAISNIKIPLHPKGDCWSWRYTKNGEFSVRSAYHLELNQGSDEPESPSNAENVTLWNKMWRVEVPPKIRNFAWRALHNALPVRATLVKRGMEVDLLCPRCGDGQEDILHMLVRCPESRMLCYVSPLRINTELVRVNSFFGWVEDLAQQYKEREWWNMFWCLAWEIWLNRNQWCFENKKKHIQELINKAMSLIREF